MYREAKYREAQKRSTPEPTKAITGPSRDDDEVRSE